MGRTGAGCGAPAVPDKSRRAMKRILLVAAFAVCVASEAMAQRVRDAVLSAGIGMGTAVNVGSRTVVPPIAFQGEYCLLDRLFDDNSALGVGAYVGFAAGKRPYTAEGYTYFTQKVNNVMLGVRGALHYQFADRLDAYLGLMLGGSIANTRSEGVWMHGGNPPRYGGFLGDVFLGARYYLLPQLALYGEFGFGVAYFTVGVSFRI